MTQPDLQAAVDARLADRLASRTCCKVSVDVARMRWKSCDAAASQETAAQVEALTVERDAAIARAEKAESELAIVCARYKSALRGLCEERDALKAEIEGHLINGQEDDQRIDTLKSALRAAGNRIVYSLQLEHHKSECGCVDCRMIKNIDALLGEKE